MREKIKQVIIDGMKEIAGVELPINNFTGEEKIAEFNINSIFFIKLLVYIETEMDIEIDDEYLNINNYTYFNEFIDFIEKCVNEQQ